ncbi:MAG: (E)-4-hydroxy-3-methylbut-2-enyl-diphosphate synthase, partial [Bacteroidia bacterium]
MNTDNLHLPVIDTKTGIIHWQRRQSREVQIGEVPLGGNNPIRIQSMTTTDTMDTEATIAQSIRMIEAGCEYVRITAPSMNEAQNLQNIKDGLHARGYKTPLVADIHFTPNAAELAAKIVEKVRINPGNYVDKKKFEQKEYTDFEYEAELERIRKRFEPLVKICKEYGTAMRIGTNHGSLSDRIMNRYGDTALGMVESALEFLRICEDQNYYNIVLSMKSSNPQVMVQAYRLLVAKMDEYGMKYPLHLGVTEAGDGNEGRIKSAMGIGSLLEDGLGDTIRVSLTEEPEFEIPVAKALAERYEKRANASEVNTNDGRISITTESKHFSPFTYMRRPTFEVGNLGNHNVPRVIIDLSKVENIDPLSLKAIDFHYNAVTDKWNMGEQGSDYIYFADNQPGFMLPNGTKGIYNYQTWLQLEDKNNNFPLLTADEFISVSTQKSPYINFVKNASEKIDAAFLEALKTDTTAVLILHTQAENAVLELRRMFVKIKAENVKNPVILHFNYSNIDKEDFLLESAADIGGLLLDGFGDGVFTQYSNPTQNYLQTTRLINQTVFYILQASRTRISKTEYISCPSCGRTLFDLQETTAMIRKETDHLKGVKLAIMGCIVNGPGEMADADYGYVGTGVGKITLYRGKEVVKRNIESKFALDELINLIKEDGLWIDK